MLGVTTHWAIGYGSDRCISVDLAVKDDDGAGEARSLSDMSVVCQSEASFGREEQALGVAGDVGTPGLAWWLYSISLLKISASLRRV